MQHRISFLLALSLAFFLKLPALVAVEIPKPDFVVATDGSGNFKTIQEAVNAIPRDSHERMVIFIKDSVYHEKVRIDPDFVTLRGQSRQGTRIEFAQGTDEFTKQPDNLGRAVVNINGNDCVIENLTVKNTHGVIGPHAFAIYGHGDKTVIVDCDVLSEGADTLALWGDRSGSYQARLNIRGSVDFVCPRGWCYMTDCTFYEVNPAAHASIWHDGSKDKNMKFVLRNCQFDGVENFILARHHHDAQFFLLDCNFSKQMRDLAPYRVIYPIAGDKPSTNDVKRNLDLNASNVWGERAYFYNCHRDGGDCAWQTNNLSSAPNAPKPEQITAAWTFAGKWDPERRDGPAITKIHQLKDRIEVVFGESVTVKGKPHLVLKAGGVGDYVRGSGSTTLVFTVPPGPPSEVAGLDLQGGAVIASEASANPRMAEGIYRNRDNRSAYDPAKGTYPIPYQLPKKAEIVEVLGRVRGYLEYAAPARIVDSKNGNQITDLTVPVANAVADRGEADAFYNLDYTMGVTHAGMLLCAEVTGDKRYADFTARHLKFIADALPYFSAQDEKFDKGRQSSFRGILHTESLDDSGAMCAALIKARRAKVGPDLEPVINHWIDYISTKQFRLPDGTLARQRPQPVSLWADDCYMGIPALAQMGALTGNRAYLDDAAKQIVQFSSHLFDPKTELYAHGWNANQPLNPEFYWGRANGWAMMATVELLDVLPADHPQREAILKYLRQHIQAVAKLQSGTGLWHQMLDKNDSYLETSASAMFVFSIAHAINRGWISPVSYGSVAQAGWNAVAQQVNRRGQVEGSCVGTTFASDNVYYYHRPASVYATHGYGPVLLAGAEMIKLLENPAVDIQYKVRTYHYGPKVGK